MLLLIAANDPIYNELKNLNTSNVTVNRKERN